MKKRIPTGIGLAIILFCAAIVLLVWRNFYQTIATVETGPVQTQVGNTALAKDKECKPRAFVGEVKISGWYVTENSEKLFQVSPSDMQWLPVKNTDPQFGEKVGKLKLVDIAPAMEKKLTASSEKKPQTITINGYALPCEGDRVFASLNYKDGIFKSPLGIN